MSTPNCNDDSRSSPGAACRREAAGVARAAGANLPPKGEGLALDAPEASAGEEELAGTRQRLQPWQRSTRYR